MEEPTARGRICDGGGGDSAVRARRHITGRTNLYTIYMRCTGVGSEKVLNNIVNRIFRTAV